MRRAPKLLQAGTRGARRYVKLHGIGTPAREQPPQIVKFLEAAASMLQAVRQVLEEALRVDRRAPAFADTLDWFRLWEGNADLGSSIASSYDTAQDHFTLEL